MRIGVCAYNGNTIPPADFMLYRGMKADTVKVMSQTAPNDVKRIQEQGIEVMVRVHNPEMRRAQFENIGEHPTPASAAKRAIRVINTKFPFVNKFQLWNEPNHAGKIEGWGASDEDAASFGDWYCEAIDIIRSKVNRPVELIFPGLATPEFLHRDLSWLYVTSIKEAIAKSDGLGVHCYFQEERFDPGGFDKMREHLHFGQKYKIYKDKFPDKKVYVLEVGCSNGQSGERNRFPIDYTEYGRFYKEWAETARDSGLVEACYFFIASSPDHKWTAEGFCLRQGSKMMPAVWALGNVIR